jgi:prophage regulatory protein
MSDKILRKRAVLEKTGLSNSTLYDRISKELFPKPISLGGRAVGWLQTELEAWIAEQVRKSRTHATEARK